MLEDFLSQSIIDATTVQAFRETEYRGSGDAPFTLRIGVASETLAAAPTRNWAACSACISGFNPFSQPLGDEANASRHTALIREIERRSLLSIEGVGKHPSNQWPDEASYLIFGLTQEAAKSLATRLERNAIVWCGSDANPQPVLLR